MNELNDEKPKLIISIGLYAFCMFILGGLVAGVLVVFFSTKYSISAENLLNAISKTSEVELENKLAALINAVSNFSVYIFLFFSLGIIFKKDLIEDFNTNIVPNKKRFITTLIIFFAFFYAASTLAELVSNSTSENQATIENIFNYNSKYIMIITTVIFAPLVEELIFRKTIFKLCKKYNDIIPLIISSVLFMALHMFEKASPIQWILTSIPYLVAGLSLGYIYIKSNKNIHMTIIIHMLNNLIACILILV